MKKLLIILLSVISLTAMAQTDVKRVAILETVDKMGTVPYLKLLMFRSNLTTAITNTSGYEGYDRADLKEILGEQNFQRTGLVSDADIKKIGEFTGAKYVLIAEAVIDGNDMFITAKIIDVETARVLRNSNQLMGTSAAEMQDGSIKVAADLLGVSSGSSTRQAVATNTSQSSAPKSSTTPSSSIGPATSTSKMVDGYVDLGLPSGTLWKEKNEDCGLISHDKAMSMYGNNLPTLDQLAELITSCVWTWTGEGYTVMGPNNKTIFIPAKGKECLYWSSTAVDMETVIFTNLNEKQAKKIKKQLIAKGGYFYCLKISPTLKELSTQLCSAGMYIRLVR